MESPQFTTDFKKMINITILNSLGFFFLDFLIPFVATTELNASGPQMGLIFSARTIGYLLTATLAGSLADRVSPKLLLIMGSAGRGFSYFLLYFSIVNQDLIMMISGNLLLGGMAGFFWIPLDMLVSSKSQASNRSEAFGYRTAAIGKGTLGGAIIGFSIFTVFNETAPELRAFVYLPLAIYGLGNIIAAALFRSIDENLTIQEERVAKSDQNQSYRQFFKSMSPQFKSAFFIILITLFLANSNASLAKPFILVYLTENIESNPTLASAAYIPAGVSSLLLAPYLGRIVDKFDQKKMLGIGIALGAVTTLFLISTESLLIFSLLLVIDGTIATTTGLIVVNIISRISVKNRGKIFGLQTVFLDLGAVFGPIVGGVLWDSYGHKSPFYLSIGIELLIIPVILFAVTRIKPFLSEQITPDSTSSPSAEADI